MPVNQIMTIGGTDSSGGAGLTRDASVAHAHGFDVLPVVTAVTAQTDALMIEARVMPDDFVTPQIDAALTSRTLKAVKIGMLGNAENADVIRSALLRLSIPIVLDPVLKSSSGGTLLAGRPCWKLLSQASLVTPNLAEAAMIANRPETTDEVEIMAMAETMLAKGAQAVLIKGGHGAGAMSCDLLMTQSEHHVFRAPRLAGNMRGTGCALATAIACNLAHGYDLVTACSIAKAYLHQCLGNASYVDTHRLFPTG